MVLRILQLIYIFMHLETTKNKSIIYLISKIYSFISKKRKLGLKILLLTQILSGLFEFLTIGSVVPFLYLINNPEVIYNYPLLAKVITISKITNSYKLTLLFSFIFISLVLISGFVKTFNVWFSYRLSALIGADLSHNIFKKKLNQPFEIQITENSSKTINEISGCLNRVVLGLQFFLQVVSNIVLTFFITLALLVIASRVTIIGFLVILISYFVIGFFVKKELSITGNKIVIYSENQVKAIQEGLGSIRDLTLSGNADVLLKDYSKIIIPLWLANAKTRFLSVFPRYFLESFGLIFIAALGILNVSQGNSSLFIPTIGSIALGIQKLLPSMQQLYNQWSILQSYTSDFEIIIKGLSLKLVSLKSYKNVIFKNNITINKVHFKYPNNFEAVSNFNLIIKKGESIGFIGTTGSGKSTIVDLIMGLLKPSKGKIFIDNKDLYENKKSILISWRKSIAHVPQLIYLTDNSFMANIAFGIPLEEINIELVKKAAKKSLIHDYIESTKDGYYTKVGERGVNLSGGQRQRVGIARAIYKILNFQVNLLVLDEATNALDIKTELEIMNNIQKMKNLTKLIISHNNKSLSFCNRIIKIGS